MKCGRTFGDRSNRLSHQKKCTATKTAPATAALPNSSTTSSGGGGGGGEGVQKQDHRPIRALPERLTLIPANTQVTGSENKTDHKLESGRNRAGSHFLTHKTM